jgi:cysteine desulfurase family protein
MSQRIIYLDNAATTIQKSPEVAEAVSRAICGLGNSGRGSYNCAMDASRIIFETRTMLAELFQADGPEQIAFTANSTHALNIAIKGVMEVGDHVITTAMEHNSVLRPLYEMEKQGMELTILSCDDLGRISINDLNYAIKENTKAVICTHASNVTGNINDIKSIGTICREKNLLFILDASQTAGVLPVHMKDMGIDIVCFTGHKGLMGPQGTGGICVRKGLNIRPLYSGGSGFHSYSKEHPDKMPTALEAGTMNVHGIAGLHAALKFISEIDQVEIYKHENRLALAFYKGIQGIKGIKLYGEFESERVGIVSINIGDYDSSIVSDELSHKFGIYTRSGAHCAPLMHQCFHTEKQGIVRFSFGYFNTEEEVEIAIEAVRTLVEEE